MDLCNPNELLSVTLYKEFEKSRLMHTILIEYTLEEKTVWTYLCCIPPVNGGTASN